jgi:hypothetical protein
MSYMDHATLLGGGVQELSLNEIDMVDGGTATAAQIIMDVVAIVRDVVQLYSDLTK